MTPKGLDKVFPGCVRQCVYRQSSFFFACQINEVLTIFLTDDNIIFDSLILSYMFH
jgi:hypothetical protein